MNKLFPNINVFLCDNNTTGYEPERREENYALFGLHTHPDENNLC